MRIRRPNLVVLLAVLLTAPALAQDQNPQTLTLAAYNVQFMMDVFDDPYTSDEGHAPKPRAKLELVAKAVRAMNADLVALVELENEGLLRTFAAEMLSESDYQYVAVLPTNSERGQNIGVISRLPILSITSHRFATLTLEGKEQTWRFARDAVHLRVQAAPDLIVHVIALHLKSRHDSPDDTNSATWRLAEATAVRKIVDDILKDEPGACIAVLGDLNDTPETATLATLLDTAGAEGRRLTDVHAAMPAGQRITYRIEPYRSTIDYILVSPALAKRLIPDSAKVLSDPGVVGGSDHCPVYASFKLD